MSLAKPLFILAMCHIFQEGWLVLRHCGACGASSCPPPCRRRAQRSLPANLDFQCKHFRFLSASPFAREKDIPWMPRPSDFPLLHGFALRRVSNFSQLRAGGTIKISVYFKYLFPKVWSTTGSDILRLLWSWEWFTFWKKISSMCESMSRSPVPNINSVVVCCWMFQILSQVKSPTESFEADHKWPVDYPVRHTWRCPSGLI